MDAGIVSSALKVSGVDGGVDTYSDSGVDAGLSSASIDFGVNGSVPSDSTKS